MMLTAADMQQMAAAYPGLNAGAKSVDAGAHVIDFWLESRKGGAAESATGIVHSEITEIYYIFQGKATIITGGTIAEPKPFAVNVPAWKGSSVVFNTPTLGGPFKGGTPRVVGPATSSSYRQAPCTSGGRSRRRCSCTSSRGSIPRRS